MSQNFSYYKSPMFAHIVIGGLFLVLTSVCLYSDFLPIHDAIEWHGAYHYYYSSIARGVVPYWNPYSRTGTPFFINFQSFGLLETSQFVGILFQKITGCTTLTTYVIHHFLMSYVFILGTYYTLRIITRDNMVSLMFAVVLLLACFPNFMRQTGTVLWFFWFPFITYFLLLFFQESREHVKGFSLFVVSFLCGLTLNVYIPQWLIFYCLLVVLFAFLLKIADIRATIRFLTSRSGLLWVSASVILVLLLSAPVIVLYYELHHETELFPSIRFLQATQKNLVKGYASDIQENLFSEEFTRNIKTSLTLGNFVGIFFEPMQHCFHGFIEISEVSLYLSILPLFCIWKALRHIKNRYTYLFLVISGLVLLLACNFSTQIHMPAGIILRIMLSIFPFLRMSDVLQNSGTLVLFSLIIVSAIGFQKMLHDKRKIDWSIPLLILFYKYCIFLLLIVLYRFSLFLYRDFNIRHPLVHTVRFAENNKFFLSILCLFILLVIILASKSLLNISRIRMVQFCILILFIDLVIVDIFYGIYGRNTDEPLFNKKYPNYLKAENLLHPKEGHTFIHYRVPFSFSNPGAHLTYAYELEGGRRIWFNSFFGHEIYSLRKSAFPGVIQVIRSQQTGEDSFTPWDHFYMTTHYYDYLVNVAYVKQLVTSHIITPILNFFPKQKALFVDSKYDVIDRINRTSFDELRTSIFIEPFPQRNPAVAADISHFFDPDNYVKYSQEEIADFDRRLRVHYPANPDVKISVTEDDINRLSLTVDTPYEGYLYFGDGYSKHWKAMVDGKPAKLEKTNINFKSVYTPEGKHSIEFIFDPVLFRYSLYAYLIGNILFLIVFITYIATFLSKRKSVYLSVNLS